MLSVRDLDKQFSVFAVSAPASGGSRDIGSGAVRLLRRSSRGRQLQGELTANANGEPQLRLESVALAIAAIVITATAPPSPSSNGVAVSPDVTRADRSTPAAANSAQPQLSVSNRGVLVSWIERSGDLATLKFAERTASGWTTARTIASGRDWFVNWADVPSVLRLPSGAIVAHWLQKSGPSTYSYDVRLSYSTDDGKTWSPSYLPHRDRTQTEHGFASLFPMGDGFGLVWLDGRARKAGGDHPSTRPGENSGTRSGQGGDEHGGGGAMSVYFARFDKAFRQVGESRRHARLRVLSDGGRRDR